MSANRVELGILIFKSEAPVNGLGSNKSIFSCVFNLLWLSCGISASQELEGYRCSLLNTAQVCFPWRFSLFSFWFEGWESFSSWPHSGVVDLGFVWGLGFVFSVLVSLGGGGHGRHSFCLILELSIGLCWSYCVVIPGELMFSSLSV